MSPELAAEVFDLLAEGGEIYVASDVFDIALDAMSVLERDCSRRLVNLREPWTFLRENPFPRVRAANDSARPRASLSGGWATGEHEFSAQISS